MGAMFFNTPDCKSSYRIGRGHKTPARTLACYLHAECAEPKATRCLSKTSEPSLSAQHMQTTEVGELESAVRQKSRIQTKPSQPRAGFFT